MKVQARLSAIASLLLALFVSLVVTAAAQERRPFGPLEGLKRVLADTGAATLTAQQETQLTELMKAFREAQKPQPDENLKAAHTAYNTALLNGDVAAAQAQVELIANLSAAQMKARLQAETKFKADVLAILKEGGQLETLRQKLDDARLVGLLGSLSGRPGGGPGFGPPPGGPGFGPGGPGGERPAQRGPRGDGIR